MKSKTTSRYSLWALAIAITLSFIYFYNFVIPMIGQDSPIIGFLVGDVALYMNPKIQDTFIESITRYNDMSDFFDNVSGMLMIGIAGSWISRDYPAYVIFFFNILIFGATIRNFQYIFDFYKSKKYHLFLFYFMLNPLLLISLVTLNKEIWGILFISSFLRHRIYQTYKRYFIITVGAFFIRNVFGAFGVIFYLMTTFKINKIYYFIVVSLLVPFIIQEPKVNLLITGQDTFSLGFSILMNNIQSYPLGYLLVYFPRLILDIISNLSPWALMNVTITNIYTICLIISEIWVLTFITVVLYRQFILKITPDAHFTSLFFAYTLIVCIEPIILHRYLFPVYPVLSMMLCLGNTRTPVVSITSTSSSKARLCRSLG